MAKQLKERADKLEQAARPARMERSSGKIALANSSTHAKALDIVTLEQLQLHALSPSPRPT